MFRQFIQKSRKAAAQKKGFTLIEILIVIGIIAILAAIVIIAINPAKQFAQARNTQRESDTNTILNAIGQNLADNKGLFKCTGIGTAIPTVDPMNPASGTHIGQGALVNLGACLVPAYIPQAIPMDPDGGAAADTLYTVQVDNVGRYSVCAPKHAEGAIPTSATYCLTR
jgi:prepilin-type N-terminal cleavage/methylation domain-containing protein